MSEEQNNKPVEYRQIEGFPGYRIGDDGSVWSCWENHGQSGNRMGGQWHHRKPVPGHGGYLTVVLGQRPWRKRKYIHHLVLLAFSGPCPDGMEARHKNGNPADNAATNLLWGTPKQNYADGVGHGTKGHNKSPARKLSVESARYIKAMKPPRYAHGIADKLAIQFGVSKGAIFSIWRGTNWSHA